MKTTVLLSILLSFSNAIHSQATYPESEKIANFCKLWGFLKYYHPTVAKGKLDWDKEFTTRIKAVTSIASKQELSKYYSAWIESLGKVKKCNKCKKEVPGRLNFNLDLIWLNDTTSFTNELIQQLNFILQNRNRGLNYYVQQYPSVGNTRYDNEKPYQDSLFPTKELRLLGLSRYWNIINYFFPYKYIIGEDWNKVLVEMVPKFRDSRDTITYNLSMLELTARINDSHARFVTPYTYAYFGTKAVPFRFKIIDNKAVVTGFYHDSLCKANDIQVGDVFLKVGTSTIEEIIREKSKYIGASNEATKLRNFFYAIFSGETDSVNTTFERNGVITNKTIYRYYFKNFNYKWIYSNSNDTCKIIEGNIGYLNLDFLKPEQTEGYMNKLKNTKAIIIDVRNYPNSTLYHLAYYLNDNKKPFVKFAIPDLSYPGTFIYKATGYCGKKNESHYSGQVILLFNETSQSHAEFTLMALQTAPNVISIGSQTAGADGNVSLITFPGNYKTHMTGIGVYYPDGRETQRIGIVPDIEVKPTIEGLKLKRDEVLEKAIEVANGI